MLLIARSKFGGFSRQVSRKVTRNDAQAQIAGGFKGWSPRALCLGQQRPNRLSPPRGVVEMLKRPPNAVANATTATRPPRPDSPPATLLPAIPPRPSSAAEPSIPAAALSVLIDSKTLCAQAIRPCARRRRSRISPRRPSSRETTSTSFPASDIKRSSSCR